MGYQQILLAPGLRQFKLPFGYQQKVSYLSIDNLMATMIGSHVSSLRLSRFLRNI